MLCKLEEVAVCCLHRNENSGELLPVKAEHRRYVFAARVLNDCLTVKEGAYQEDGRLIYRSAPAVILLRYSRVIEMRVGKLARN